MAGRAMPGGLPPRQAGAIHQTASWEEGAMPTVVDVQGLHKQYGSTVAVDDVSLHVEEGEIFGILGPNGAGKTTTVECIEGLRTADQGEISVLGLDPRRDRGRLTEVLGVQLQDSALPDRLRVAEALELYSSFYRQPADWRALLESLGLEGKRDTPFAKLSGGQRQRLSIALALVGSPRVAVLDELTTGLDPRARRDTWALIEGVRDRGVTILLVTHFMEEAERLCDRVAVIDAGRIVAIGTPAELTSGLGAETRMRFRPSVPIADELLTRLPEVTSLTRRGDTVLVAGTENVVNAVTSVLATHRIIAQQLRVDQASLEDVFVSLTDHDAPADAR
jgi:ABC-2 type transport system ATP-binding protein